MTPMLNEPRRSAATLVGVMTLVLVELRKTVDTRAARWLLAVVAVLTVAAPLVQTGPWTFPDLAGAAQLPVSILLPVLAVLSVTSEWSQRTALTTFALVPRRWRVVLAKLAAVALLGLAAALFALGCAAAFAGDLDPAVAAQLVLVELATMLCGFGFGLLVLSSAPGVAAYYVLPIAWAAAGRLVPALEPAARWLDLSRTRVPLAAPGVSAQEWTRFGASAALWVVLPVLVGLLRTARADVR
ncbi:ABC transporter permease [Dactylosporangium sp. CS-033363]|uniref:ABC transporter permease n=1 Tax=Dactylosporangium sp. CS-033363 TaxID=3239935 RepID=UPI003D8B57E3